MDEVQVYEIGSHRVTIACRDGVGPPTPYSLLLAEHIPEMPGRTVVDVGTGSGFLGIVARLQGAARVYVLDTDAAAISVAMENAERNAVQDGFVHLPTGRTILPLPAGETVDMVLCNPAQLPLPEADRADSPFYAGKDGRQMIEEVIRETPERLSSSGQLLMTHNSLTDFPASVRLMESLGLEPQVLAQRSLEFRPLSIVIGSTSWAVSPGGFTPCATAGPTRPCTSWRPAFVPGQVCSGAKIGTEQGARR